MTATNASENQLVKLTANDGSASDHFGRSVGISSGIAIVGSYGDEAAGADSGSAYLFDVASGTQLGKLWAADVGPDDRFGWSVGINEGVAIVGAQYDDDDGSDSGSAYLFDVATGTQLEKLTANDAAAGDWFGVSVAVDSGMAIVGSQRDNSTAGSAYLFDVATGAQQAKLTANDSAVFDNFGISVDINGGVAIVGSPQDDDAGSGSGSAYLFDTATGTQLAKLTASDAEEGDLFGISVAISDGVAVVGSYWDDDSGSRSGSAYLFDVTNGMQLAKLTASDAEEGDWFGSSVAIHGGVVVVGSQLDDDFAANSGSAYLFDVNTGMQLDKLTASDAEADDRFGFSVAIDQGVAIVGSDRDDDAGAESGSAYLFEIVPEPASFPMAFALAFVALRRHRRT